MVQSENAAGVLVCNLVVSVYALLSRGPERIARIEVPDCDVLTASPGNFKHEIVVVAEGRAHEGRLYTADSLEGQFNSLHLVMDLGR